MRTLPNSNSSLISSRRFMIAVSGLAISSLMCSASLGQAPILAASATITAAQDDNAVTIEEALRICNRIKNSRDRLDCFEGLADAAAPEQETTVRNSAEPAPATPGDPIGSTPEFAEAGPGKTPGTPNKSASVEIPTIQPAQPDENGNVPESASSKRFVILEEDEAKKRLDEVRTPREKREKYTANVRKAWFNGNRKLMVLFDNGEIWKQNQSERARAPKVGTAAEFKPKVSGSWFVKLPPNHRSVRMRIINP